MTRRIARRPLVALLLGALCALSACASVPRDGGAVFFPAPPGEPRIQYLTHFSSSRDVQQKRSAFSRFVLGGDDAADDVIKPYGVAISGGRIYVCDTKRNLINIFDLEGRRFGYLGFEGPGQLRKPINVAVDERGEKYVADAERGEVVRFGADDAFLGAFGGADLQKPVDVAVSAERIYVCDTQTCEIVVFDRSSQRPLFRFGGCGTGDEQFARPTNVAVDTAGNVYVSDTINGRVRKCDPEGRPLRTFGSLGTEPGQFARPKGVSTDAEGRLYVVDAAFENVQLFDSEGRLLTFFGGAGNAPGQLNLPAQVVVDYENVERFAGYAEPGFDVEYLVLVTSQYGIRKVSVFGFGRMNGSAR